MFVCVFAVALSFFDVPFFCFCGFPPPSSPAVEERFSFPPFFRIDTMASTSGLATLTTAKQNGHLDSAGAENLKAAGVRRVVGSLGEGTSNVIKRVCYEKDLSLPYSARFITAAGLEFFRVIHNRRVRVCRGCLQASHVLRECPDFWSPYH